jgi:hypothetical protein
MARARLDIEKFNSMGNKRGRTASNISGWTYAASTKPTMRSSPRLLRRYFADIGMRQGATFIYPIYRPVNAVNPVKTSRYRN